MPYGKLEELPDAIKNSLPTAAQKIWMAVFNSAASGGDSEESCVKIAWSAVKKKFEKKGDAWVAKKSESLLVREKLSVGSEWSNNVAAAIVLGETFEDLSEEEISKQKTYLEELIDVGRDWDRDVVLLQEVDKKLKSISVVEGDWPESDLPIAEKAEGDSDNVYNLRITEMFDTFEGKTSISDGKRFVVLRIMTPGWSRNGNYWSTEVANQFVDHIMKEGSRKLYMNHQLDPRERRYGRKMEDWVATLIESKTVNNVPMARVQIYEKNAKASDLWEKIREHPGEVGTSVDARVKMKVGTAEGKKGNIIEEVVSLYSLDFVDRPSAGGGVVSIAASDISADERELINDYVENCLLVLEKAGLTLKDQLKSKGDTERLWQLQDALRMVLKKIMLAEDLDEEAKKKSIEQASLDFAKEMGKLDPIIFEGSKPNEQTEDVMFNTLEEFKEKQPELFEAFMKSARELVGSEEEHKAALETEKKLKARVEELEKNEKTLQQKIDTFETEKKQAEKKASRMKLVEEAKLEEDLVSETFLESVVDAETDEKAALLIEDRKKIQESVNKKKKAGDNWAAPKSEKKPASKDNDNKFDPDKVITETTGLSKVKV